MVFATHIIVVVVIVGIRMLKGVVRVGVTALLAALVGVVGALRVV